MDDVTLSPGVLLPPWFWLAVADGRVEITDAHFGQLFWGLKGIDLIGEGEVRHLDMGETLKRSDVA